MKEHLKITGGDGLFDRPVSTSNLYTPNRQSVEKYLSITTSKQESHHTQILSLLSERLCNYHQSRYCVLFSTGFWALVASIKLRALSKKKYVLIPSLTYRRLADVVYWAGYTPSFVDIDQSTLAISPESTEAAINSDTALILAVHPIINCCDVFALKDLASRRGIPIIFDAVESVHETYRGKRIGSFGVGEVFSFHASKLINGLEGGYVCTNDQNFAMMLEQFRGDPMHGSVGDRPGYILNGLLHPAHAAFALAGLDEIDANISHNKSIYRKYESRLNEVSGIRLLQFDEAQQTSYKNIVVEITNEFPLSRDILVTCMNMEDILARKYYCPALHNKKTRYQTHSNSLPYTQYAESRYLNLPCGSRVTLEHVDLICDFLLLLSKEPDLYKEKA